jgi:hypothetical protein
MTIVVTAKHPKRGTLWAAFDPAVHHIKGAVRDSRFGAKLSPFRSMDEAKAALVAAGATIERADA